MKHTPPTSANPDSPEVLERSPRTKLWAYITGFVLSLLLTVTAYTTVFDRSVTSVTANITAIIVGLAVAQLLVQLVFFLHLGREPRPRVNLMVFGFMLVVLGILVLGSLWIMHNLDYHMQMGPHEMDRYMLEQSRSGGL